MSKIFQKFLLFIVVLFLITISSVAKNKETNSKKVKGRELLRKTNGKPSRTHFNINNISTWINNNGITDIAPSFNSGFIFPKGSNKAVVYETGFLWGATIAGERRVGGSAYRSGLLPGRIKEDGRREDETLEHVRIYRVRKDWATGDLSAEMADEGVPEDEVRAQYEKDWNEWPAQYGAPYEDVDGNGTYDVGVDIPGFPGADQTIWFVANDLDLAQCRFLYGSDPMGIEMQATFWGYNTQGALGNTMFRKYKIINKSPVTFDTMYVSLWSDPDLGGAGDDFSGCDVDLSLAFTYNGLATDAQYGNTPPAVGFDFFQGPIVAGAPTDTAIFNNKKRGGFKNLPMSAHYFFINGDNVYSDPTQGDYVNGTLRFHNLFRGRISTSGAPFVDPTTGETTVFTLSGDPLTGTGWVDGILHAPGDRRQGMVAGPFTMAAGDTQEVVVAEIAAFGKNNLDAITKLKQIDYYLQDVFNNLFNFEFVPIPRSILSNIIEKDKEPYLKWEQSAELESFNQDGFKFQGYNIYQFNNSDISHLSSWKKIKTFDEIDGVTTISQLVYNPTLKRETMTRVQVGTDSGLEYEFKIEKDYINDSKLLIGKPYYFGITSYTYTKDVSKKIKTSESEAKVVELIYRKNEGGIKYGDSLEVVHFQGNSNESVKVTVIDRTELTGDDYEVFFSKQHYYLNSENQWIETTATDSIHSVRIEKHWNIKNITTGNTVLEKQRVFDCTDVYAKYWNVPSKLDCEAGTVVDGFRVKVSGSIEPLEGISSYFYNNRGPLRFAHGQGFKLDMSDFGMHGWAASGRAVDAFGNGTTNVDILQKDYELRFTGEYEPLGADSVYRVKEGTGSMATLYSARGYDIKDHPLNPNPGSSDPFLVRIPFEVWNVDDNRQVNLLIYDRKGMLDKKPFYAFNPFGRMYCYPNNTPYVADVVNSADATKADTDNLTWNWIFWRADWKKGDVVKINYNNPLIVGIDKFSFNSFTLTSINEDKIPKEYSLSQNYPNPFNPTTTIQYDLPKGKPVRLDIYNILGEKIITLVNKEQKAGYYKYTWNGNNNYGNKVCSGVYLYRLVAGDYVKTKKMILLK